METILAQYADFLYKQFLKRIRLQFLQDNLNQ